MFSLINKRNEFIIYVTKRLRSHPVALYAICIFNKKGLLCPYLIHQVLLAIKN
ncbi:MAG: hypothetical protein JWP78_993 [Mucilaginibacter sp.]|nr:hypothetical protein [Mucilaginibacter sp.]